MSAPGQWRHLKLSQLSSSSHPSCCQWEHSAQHNQTLVIRRSSCFRAQASASSSQPFPTPTSVFTSPRWGPHQGHHNHTWHYHSCHHHTCSRQSLTSHPSASQDAWKWGGQIRDNRADGGCGRVSFKKNEGFHSVNWLIWCCCIVC